MKIYVTTDGCEVGQLYSAHAQRILLNNDPKIVKTTDPREADLIIFYACGLTETSERKSLLIIETLKSKMKSSARIVVWGCLSKQNPELLAKSYAGPILGPSDFHIFDEILKQATGVPQCADATKIPDANFPITGEPLDLDNSLTKPNFIKDSIRATLRGLNGYLSTLLFKANSPTFYIRVAEGCESHCTYCSEHIAWGKVKSKPIEKIISEFEDGLQKGYTTFFLCAEDLGAYGVDIGLNACDLLKQLVNLNNDINYKIVINEMSPPYLKKMFSDFEKVFATGKIGTLGCQVESGSNRILKLMGREYKAEEWKNLMLHVNRKFPQINLTTHFMVGFPTEAEEDFKATMKLLDFPLFLQEILIFKFSPRPNIPASRLPGQIPESTKESRYKELERKFRYRYPLNMAIRYSYSLAKKSSSTSQYHESACLPSIGNECVDGRL
jgi:threonylcarbamoyladenosine tRNA methylthiotransferase MtaB